MIGVAFPFQRTGASGGGGQFPEESRHSGYIRCRPSPSQGQPEVDYLEHCCCTNIIKS